MKPLSREQWAQVGFGAVALFGYELLAYLVGEFYPETKPTAFVVATGLAVQTMFMDRLLRAFRQGRKPINKSLVKMSQLVDRLDDDWQKQVAQELFERTVKIFEELRKPVDTYDTETRLYNAMTARAGRLKHGNTLYAICGRKTWKSPAVYEYMEANRDAAANGAHVTRIFFDFDNNSREEAQRQADRGILASWLARDKIELLRSVSRIPPDLGIAIFDDETVFVHRGLDKQLRGSRYECRHLAAMIRSMFSAVEEVAERVERVPARSDVKPDRRGNGKSS